MIDWNDIPVVGGDLLMAHGRPPTFMEADGTIRILEFEDLAPYFQPRRLFEIRDVPGEAMRANHAHRTCWQAFLPNVSAYRLEIMAPTGESVELRLDPWGDMVVVPPWRWARIRGMQREAVLTVLASHPYDTADYLYDEAEFRKGPGE